MSSAADAAAPSPTEDAAVLDGANAEGAAPVAGEAPSKSALKKAEKIKALEAKRAAAAAAAEAKAALAAKAAAEAGGAGEAPKKVRHHGLPSRHERSRMRVCLCVVCAIVACARVSLLLRP